LGIALEFLAQSQDMRVHRPGRREVLIAPDLVEQAIPRDHLPLVLHEVAQEIELLAGELDLPTRLVHLAPSQAHPHVAEGELLELLPRPGAPQDGADPREQLAQGEGLGDVVVRPQLQAEHAVGLLPRAVSMITGTSSPLPRILRQTSQPLMPGIMMSSRTRSGASDSARSRPRLPSEADRV